MDKEDKLNNIIKGYNREKEILVSKLSILPSNNNSINTRSSIENRLKQIDEQIILLMKTVK